MKKAATLIILFLASLSLTASSIYPAGKKNAGSTPLVIDNGEKVTFNENNTNFSILLKNGSIWSGDVSLTKPFGSSVTVEKGEMHFCFNNTANNYASIDVPIILCDGAELGVYTSRYTYWMSKLTGSGTVNLYGGGERSYTGNAKNAAIPDWSGFTGTVNVLPYKDVISTCGFYGLVLNAPKTFYPDDVEGGLNEGRYNNMFEHATLRITNGATVANENGNRAIRIGHLEMEEGSVLKGYYKSSSAKSYYIVGGDDTNSTLYGKFAPESGNLLGLLKEGKGTYTIAGNQNAITGGIRVMEGAINVDGNTGAATSGAVATVCPNALLGGVGTINGEVAIYGNLRPGNDEIGTLTIGTESKTANLLLAPSAVLYFRIGTEKHDELDVNGFLNWTGKNYDFTASSGMPVIKPIISDDLEYVPSAEYVLIKSSLNANSSPDGEDDGINRGFCIANPDPEKWNVIQKSDADGYEYYVLKAEPSTNPNDIAYNFDEFEDDDDDIEYDLADFDFTMKSDRKMIKYYADLVGKKVGVAVPVYKMSINDPNNSRTKAITSNFNICVAENEMKPDALQPNQGQFDFYNADKLIELAQANNMRVRGHTLVWYQQNPGWISSDGKKNDKNWTREQALEIMKNHITTVMQHFKGKVYEWDVVNEMLDDDQSIVRTNPDGYNLRSNVWLKAIGEDYVDSALVYAHRADPDAKLYINEYGVEMYGSAKTEAYFNLAKRLLKDGIPLDGVGLQCHLSVGELNEKKFDANVARYADLGINCIVTELDMSIKDFSDPDHYNRQALEYYKIVKTMLKYDHFPHLIIWGVTDDLSWRGGEPLLFDSSVTKKPAYWAIRNTLRDYFNTGIDTPLSPGLQTDNGAIYNIQGQRVSADYRGIVIQSGKKYLKK